MRQAESSHREGQLFWTWPLEARSELFPAAPWAPFDVHPRALACRPGSRRDLQHHPPPPARLAPEPWALGENEEESHEADSGWRDGLSEPAMHKEKTYRK